MGHSRALNSDAYGNWTDGLVIDDAFEAGIKARAQKGGSTTLPQPSIPSQYMHTDSVVMRR